MNVKVQLIQPHTHAGQRYAPDDVIEVTEPEADWLKAQGIVQQGNTQTRWPVAAPTDEDNDP